MLSILFKTIYMKSNEFFIDNEPYLQIASPLAELPKKVYVKGTLPSERRLSVAIIGTRRPTSYGTRVACEFAESLARRGVIIISGLAYGIDTAAHQGALAANGTTIAILAHGLDRVYPAGNQPLARQILAQNGALLSPYPEGSPIQKYHFLERNQWVSALADAVLVVEAEQHSGTQATVRYALDQGKEVFAIPGPIDRSQAHGPNRLIQQGAHPALEPDDILAVIAPHLRVKAAMHDDTADPLITALLDAPVTIDQLVEQLHMPTATILQQLTHLQLQGVARTDATGRWQLTGRRE